MGFGDFGTSKIGTLISYGEVGTIGNHLDIWCGKKLLAVSSHGDWRFQDFKNRNLDPDGEVGTINENYRGMVCEKLLAASSHGDWRFWDFKQKTQTDHGEVAITSQSPGSMV